MASQIEVKIIGDASSVQRAFAQAGASASGFGSTLGSAGAKVAHAGKIMAVALGGALVAGAVASVKAFAEFEATLNSFQAVSGATGDEMERVSALAKELGNDISLPGASAADAAEAMTELAKGGLSVADSMDAVKATLQLATAAQIENADAATIVADALNSFGLEGKEAGRVADLLAASANATTAEISDMALALKASSAVANQLGIPIEDLTTAIGLMANAGIKGSDAGTSLKTMMLSLAAPTDRAAAAMQDLGLKVFDASGQMLPLPDIIRNWQTATEGLSQAQEIQAMKTIFGTDAIRAAQIVLGSAPGAWDKLSDAINREGAAADLAAAKSKGISGAIDAIKSAAETAAITFGEMLAPGVRKLAEWIKQGIDWITKLGEKLGEAEGFRAKLGVIASAFGELADRLLDAIRGVDWNAVFGAIGDALERVPWGKIAGTAARLLAAAIPPAFGVVTTAFVGFFRGIGEEIGAAIDEALAKAFAGAAEFVAGALADMVGGLADVVEKMDALDKVLIGSPFGDTADDLRGVAESLQGAADAAGNFKTRQEQTNEALAEGKAALDGQKAATQGWLDTLRGANGQIPVTTQGISNMAAALANSEGKIKLADAAALALAASLGYIPSEKQVNMLLRDEDARGRLTSWLSQLNGMPLTKETLAKLLVDGAIANADALQEEIAAIPASSEQAAGATAGTAGQWSAAGTAIGTAAANGVKGGIAGMVAQTGATVQAAIGAVTGKVSAMNTAGKNVGDAGAKGMDGGLKPSVQQSGKHAQDAANAVRNKSGEMKNAGDRVGDAGRTGVTSALKPLPGEVGQKVSAARSAAAGYQGAFRSTGVSLGAGLKGGVMAGLAGLIAEVAATVQAAVAAAAAAAQIRSPSRKMHHIGYMMIVGLEEGWSSREHDFLARVARTIAAAAAIGRPIIDGIEGGNVPVLPERRPFVDTSFGGRPPGAPAGSSWAGMYGTAAPAAIAAYQAGTYGPGWTPSSPVQAPPVVNVYVGGSVIQNQDLALTVRDAILSGPGQANPSLWGGRA